MIGYDSHHQHTRRCSSVCTRFNSLKRLLRLPEINLQASQTPALGCPDSISILCKKNISLCHTVQANCYANCHISTDAILYFGLQTRQHHTVKREMRTSKIMSAFAIMSMMGGRASAKQLLTQNINLLYVRQLGNQKQPGYCNNSLATKQPEGAVVSLAVADQVSEVCLCCTSAQ